MTEIEKARKLFVSCRLKEAKPLLEELAGAGDSDALYMLAMMTYDVDIAIEILAKSAAKGNAGAKLMRLALMADASEETIAEAEKSIIPEIEKGAEEDPVLADALGTFYLVYGKKHEGWTEKGMALLSMAEQKEYWKASIHLGSAFNELRENPLGDADRFNPGEAIIHFSFAAVKGAPEAEYFMGFLVYRGLGTKQDQKAAIQLWKKAAASGYMTAALTLGFVLSFSKNEKEKKDGFKYTKMAAESGDPTAEGNLANCYYYGTGTRKDRRLARLYYKKSRREGDGVVCHAAWRHVPRRRQGRQSL